MIALCIHIGILLIHEKKHIWISSNKVDEPRANFTEWSKSEWERQIYYNITYMWNLERWCNRNRVTDVENRLMGRKTGGMFWEAGIDIYTLVYLN